MVLPKFGEAGSFWGMSAKEDLERRLERLYRRRQFGIKPGLAAVERLCELLGNPQHKYGVIHVAGTNGKGSVCALIESILCESGISTGLYTSPHLVRFNERFRINGREIDDRELADVLDECEAAAEQVRAESGRDATFFEIATVLAFECFCRAGVKLAVVETGLGGRLDATNVVMPLVSVITGISREHTAWLGDSIEEIAAEKCGIIKPGCPVVAALQPEEAARRVIGAVAGERGCRLVPAAEAVGVRRVSGDLAGQKIRLESVGGLALTAQLSLIGEHQLENCATAVASVEVLFNLLGDEIDPLAVKAGLEKVSWPGRCQLLRNDPPVIVDAAHNPAGARALVKTLRGNGVRRAVIVLGMCRDKDVAGVLGELAAIAAGVYIVPLANERGMPPEELAAVASARGLPAMAAAGLAEGLSAAEMAAKQKNLPLVITGSLFLLAEVLKNA